MVFKLLFHKHGIAPHSLRLSLISLWNSPVVFNVDVLHIFCKLYPKYFKHADVIINYISLIPLSISLSLVYGITFLVY